MMEQGQHIEKMAIVGDEKWKDDAFASPPQDSSHDHRIVRRVRLNEARTC
jgi:hypothetical protein